MPKLILSFPEAQVLRAVDGDANTHQLSSSTKLVPSDVSKAVHQLADRKLILLDDGNVVLTKDGMIAQRKLVSQPSSSNTMSPSDVLVIDTEPVKFDWSLDDLNSSIDAELDKLK
jgi:hypothetical protein